VRVLIDSSAWIDFLNDFPSPHAAEVERLVKSDDEVCTCGLVALEVLQGLRRSSSFPEAQAMFEELTLLEPAGLETYLVAARLYAALRRGGKTLRSAVDCVVLALADEHRCWVLARDRDIEAILESGELPNVQAWPLPHG
jgi:predicted nucleic acid-binding protein